MLNKKTLIVFIILLANIVGERRQLLCGIPYKPLNLTGKKYTQVDYDPWIDGFPWGLGD